MKGILSKLADKLILQFVRDAFLLSLLWGIIFAIVFTYLIGAFAGVLDPLKTWPFYNLHEGSSHGWLAILFVSFALLLTLLGYLSRLNVRDDLLTPLRKKLIGAWQVKSKSWQIHPDKIEYGLVKSICVIDISPIHGKLTMRFEIKESDIFVDQDIDIETTAFSGDPSAPRLVYFHETELELKDGIRPPSDPSSKITFPFLGVLKIKIEKDGTIEEMKGHWYDINNGVYNLARRIDELQGFGALSNAVENGAVTFGGDVSFEKIKSSQPE